MPTHLLDQSSELFERLVEKPVHLLVIDVDGVSGSHRELLRRVRLAKGGDSLPIALLAANDLLMPIDPLMMNLRKPISLPDLAVTAASLIKLGGR